MTKVRFTFNHVEGGPMANMEFTLLLSRASFNEEDIGVVLPESVVVTTNELGEAIVDMWPLKAAYKIRIAPEYEDACGKLNWTFYVPQSTEIVDAQQLFLVPPPRNIPWDEEAINKINQAVIDTHNSEVAAAASAVAADASADRAELAAQGVEDYAAAAAQSAAEAEASNVSAGQHETAANAAKIAAETARDQANASQTGAANSATAAATSAGQAYDSSVASQTYATASEAARDAAVLAQNSAAESATDAAASVVLTHADVTTTAANKAATAADVVTVTGLKNDAAASAADAAASAQAAEDALGSITGVIADGGPIDLSGGTYPTKPAVSTVWRVTVGGTVTSVPEGTITYFEGDQLNYTKDQDIFYRTATAVRVSSVAGRTGDVVLSKTDVGLANVDNTSDVNKPISIAQQAAFDARTPTVGRQDTTAGRLVKVGDYGRNGAGPIVQANTVDANTLTVEGLYMFNNGGINVPEAAWVEHMPHSVADYAKQVAWGLLTDKVYVRSQKAGVWGNWTTTVEIVDNLTSSDTDKALSARQGKELLQLLQANNATVVRYTYNVAVGQTVITGPSLEGTTLAYVPGVPFILEKDGFPLLGTDYTATNGTSITLAVSPAIACQISITVFGSFSVADHYTKAQADARYYQKTETYSQAEVNNKITALSLKSASKADIVGAVSQESGVPTGAIIEYSEDGNGSTCTRYADGTQVCTYFFRSPTVYALDNAVGSLWRTRDTALLLPDVSYLKPFATGKLPVLSYTCRMDSWYGFPALLAGTRLVNKWVPCHIVSLASVSTFVEINCIATGRWY